MRKIVIMKSIVTPLIIVILLVSGLLLNGCGGGGDGNGGGVTCSFCNSNSDCASGFGCDTSISRCGPFNEIFFCPASPSESLISSANLFNEGHCLPCESNIDCSPNLDCALFDDGSQLCSNEETVCLPAGYAKN